MFITIKYIYDMSAIVQNDFFIVYKKLTYYNYHYNRYNIIVITMSIVVKVKR